MTTPPTAEPAKPAAVLRDRDAVRDYLAGLVEPARREIVVFAPQMDAHFFNGARLGRALASFAARHRYNLARLLVEDAGQVLRDNDRLVELCRRLSEFVPLRQVAEEHRGLREMFVVVDGAAYLHQPDVTEPECVGHPAARRQASDLLHRFEAMWERAEPLVGLHTAGLRS